MKTTAILLTGLLLTLQMLVAGPGYTQGKEMKEISLEFANAPIREVFKAIEKKAGVAIIFESTDDLKNERINLSIKGKVGDIMDSLLKGKELTWTIRKNVIRIGSFRSDPLIPDPKSMAAILPPPIDVKGRVINEKGEPVSGATVTVKGSDKSTATNENGEFFLSAVDENAALIFTSVNTEVTQVELNNRTSLLIRVKTKIKEMEELNVSVSTGYQTISPGRATGSYHVAGEKELSRLATTDYRQRLEGLVPGLLTGRSGSVTVRGQGTFNAERAPLIVIDGVPIEGADYKVNPDDIQQITVLKDAASASVWGVRSANGVVVITTKRGNRSGKTAVNYNNFISYEEKAELSDLRLLPASKYAWGEWNKYRSFGTGFLQPYSFVTEIGKIFNDYKADDNLSRAESRVDSLAAFNNQRQVEDLFYRNAFMNNHTVSVTTGDLRISHYLSVNFVNDRTFQQGNDLNKVNFISNSDFTISPKMKLQFGTRGSFYNANLNAESVNNIKPYIKIRDNSHNYLNENFGVAQDYKDLLMNAGWRNWDYNRYQEQQNNDHQQKSNNYAANIRFTYELVKGLKYTLQGNYEKSFQKDRNLHNESSYYTRDLINRFTKNNNLLSPQLDTAYLGKTGSILTENILESTSFDVRNQLEYDRIINGVSMNILAGHELYNSSSNGNFNTYVGYNPQTLVQTDVDRRALRTGVTGYNAVQNGTSFPSPFASVNESIERYLSYYSTVALSYRDKYHLFGSARLDKTNLLVKADRFRNNPAWSAGGKWRISREDFFKVNFINALALKASYGVSGNIVKSTAPDMIASAFVSNIGLPALMVTNPENKSLGWEKTYTLNLGTEFSLFGNRLSGTVEYYHKNGRELLYDVTIDPTLGWSNVSKNAASIVNKGLDVSLTAQALRYGDFRWDVNLVLAYNDNKVKSVDYTPTQSDILGQGNPIVGKPLNYLAVVNFLGINANGDQMISTQHAKDTLGAGNLKDFTVDDYIYAGRKDPVFFGSLTETFRCKNWSLEALFTFKLGHKLLLPTYQNSIGSGAVNEWSDPDMTWKEPGDEELKPYPRLINGAYTTDVEYIMTHNQQLVDKAALVRLRMLSIGYDLSGLLKSRLIKESSVRISGENLWYWSANSYKLDSDYLVGSSFSSSSSLILPARRKWVIHLKFIF